MNIKPAKRRRTALVPVTTLEDLPILTEAEEKDLLGSLDQAESEIRSGKSIKYDPKIFRDRLLGIYRANKQRR